MVRLIQWHSVVKLSLDVFQAYSSKNIIRYSAFVRPISLTKLCGSPALFRDMERKRKPERKRRNLSGVRYWQTPTTIIVRTIGKH